MTEPSSGVSRGDLGERLLHRCQQGFVGSSSKLPQDVLYLGERLLYGVQVRRIGWHEHQLGSSGFDEFPYPLWPVRSQVIHHYHLPLSKRWSQQVLYVNLKGLGIGSSLKTHRLSHPIKTHRGDQSQVPAPVLGHLAVSSLSFWSPRPQAIHRDVRPALIHKH